jgi:hypothetical protein
MGSNRVIYIDYPGSKLESSLGLNLVLYNIPYKKCIILGLSDLLLKTYFLNDPKVKCLSPNFEFIQIWSIQKTVLNLAFHDTTVVKLSIKLDNVYHELNREKKFQNFWTETP